MYKLSFIILALAGISQARTFPKFPGKIVGGHDVEIKDYPHQISMQYYGSHICGGSIIDELHVVTSARCTEGVGVEALFIRAGSNRNTIGGLLVGVDEIRQHPDYNSDDMTNDISVLVLNYPLNVGDPATLPAQDEQPEVGSIGTCTGWGELWENGPEPTQLQGVELPIVDREECAKAYGKDKIDDSVLCAGGGGKYACHGDAGGPLVIDGKLVGVVSLGYGCTDPKHPALFTNVGALRSFIDESMRT